MAETAITTDAEERPSLPQRDTGLRRCIVSRVKRPRAAMLRFVVDPDGRVVFDVADRLPGRGVWLTPDRDFLLKAIKTGRFKAAFKAEVETQPDLADTVTALLDRRLSELLGLARSASQVAAGWEQSQQFSRRNKIGLVVVASDAAPGSRRKLQGLAPNAPVMDMLDSVTLGQALGRERVVNALVSRGRFAEMLEREAARRRGLNGGQDDGVAAMTPGGEDSNS